MNFFTNCDDEFNNKIVPFWQTKIAFNECATMIKSENGEITANLLFKPTKILEVRDASLEKVYEQGKDYIWEKGTNKLKLAENSEIPYTMPKLTALARLRSCGLTWSTGTPNTRAAVAAWKSSPSLKAATRCSSAERCASRRSSICE